MSLFHRLESRLQEDGERYAQKGKRFEGLWRNHLNTSRDLILQGLAKAQSGRAVILGASDGKELPLQALVERLDAVCLVDIDEASMHRARNALPETLRPRCELQVVDLTQGCIRTLLDQAEPVLAVEKGGDVAQALVEVLDSISAEFQPQPWLERWRGSYVVSSMVLSQLLPLPERVLSKACEARLGSTLNDLSHGPLTKARQALALRLLNQHMALLRFLAGSSAVYLGSDVRRELVMNALRPAQAQVLGERCAKALMALDWTRALEQRAPGPLGGGPFTAWATALVGRGVLAPQEERELMDLMVNLAQELEPEVARPLLPCALPELVAEGFSVLDGPHQWRWYLDPVNYFRGGVHGVEAWLLKPVQDQ